VEAEILEFLHKLVNRPAKLEGAPANSLTVVIPSKDRNEMLLRLLGYFSAARLPYKVLVLLSGSIPVDTTGQFPSLDLEIATFDKNISLHEKLRIGVRKIKTPLVALCTDDDIVLADAIAKAGGFLINNPDYSAAQGYHAVFAEEGSNVNFLQIAWFTPSIDVADPLVRLNELILRYQPVCWAVFRTDVVRAIVQSFVQHFGYFFQEMLWSAIPVLTGKVKRIPMVYCMRRHARLHLMGHPIFAIMESPQTFFSQYLEYRTMLMTFIPSGERDKVARAIDVLHLCFFSRATDTSLWQYFMDQILKNPSVSIHDPAVNRQLRPPEINLSTGWRTEIKRDTVTYRMFPEFLSPQPKSEILLSDDYHHALISDIHRYFAMPNGKIAN
jgi:glycosyltransferase domain-containing protein